MVSSGIHQLQLGPPIPAVVLPVVPWLVDRIAELIDPLGLFESFDLVADVYRTGQSQIWREILWWEYAVEPQVRDTSSEYWQLASLSPSWRRKLRLRIKVELETAITSLTDQAWWAHFLEQCYRKLLVLRIIMSLRTKVTVLTMKAAQRRDYPVGTPAQIVLQRLGYVYAYPEVAAEVIPPVQLVGRREASRLMALLGREGYGEILQGYVWQILNRPGTLTRPRLRDRTPDPSTMTEAIDPQRAPELAADQFVNAIQSWMSGPDILAGWLRLRLGSVFRVEYGLSKGRKTFLQAGFKQEHRSGDQGDPSHISWDPADPSGTYSYDEIEQRLLLDTISDQAPPAQREAIEIYLEAARSGRSIQDVSSERGRDPVVVRNNMAALKRRLRKSRLSN